MGESGQPKITVAGTGLDRADVLLAVDVLDLLTKPDEPGLGMNVLPAHAGDLTTAHAMERRTDGLAGRSDQRWASSGTSTAASGVPQPVTESQPGPAG